MQNAVDQAKCIAASIVGRSENYRAVPWFWTDQYDIKLQMAGLSGHYDRVVTRGEPESRKFSVFYFRDGRLSAVDSVNRPGDHLAARKLIGAGTGITPEQAADLKRGPEGAGLAGYRRPLVAARLTPAQRAVTFGSLRGAKISLR